MDKRSTCSSRLNASPFLHRSLITSQTTTREMEAGEFFVDSVPRDGDSALKNRKTHRPSAPLRLLPTTHCSARNPLPASGQLTTRAKALLRLGGRGKEARGLQQALHPVGFSASALRSSWKSDRSKPQSKDLVPEEDPLPLMEDVMVGPEQVPRELAPSLEEPEKEAPVPEGSEVEKKAEESSPVPRRPCSPEERRNMQRERLNQILLTLLEKIPGKNGESLASACGPGRTAATPHFGRVALDLSAA